MVTTTANMGGGNPLFNLSIDELREMAVGLGATNVVGLTSDQLITEISNHPDYNPIMEKGVAGAEVKGKKVHPVFGEYKSVVVHCTEDAPDKTSIFISINAYTVEFHPGTKVSLPIGIIKFIKQAHVMKHYYDKSAMSEMGVLGAHMTRKVPMYIIESGEF